MIKFWKHYRSGRKGVKTPPEQQNIPEREETVRDSTFSTAPASGSKRVSLLIRQQNALARTFQAGIDSLKPVGGAASDFAMDEAYPSLTQQKLVNSRAGYLPIAQLEWYSNQGFIGWQMCGVLAQNWLIDKACGVPAQDAVRKGYDVTLNDGNQIDPKVLNAIRLADKKMNIPRKLKTFIKKGRIFGIRHALFVIDGIDYELPFNADGIKPGSYRGITQIDPYWLAPVLDSAAAANPASPEFYDPTWWLVNGKKIHRSHFIIMRNGDEVVDILKPSYIYGGISIPQKIFERVYAAERTANESPMLLLSKRMTVLKTDTTKIFGPESKFNDQVEKWAEYQNNFGIKVVGTDDEVQQFDAALSELNETIMTQFGLVAAAANVPITKLMGTPPKGMDATGEYDEASYHEEIESIQEEIGAPFVERHHLCLMRSYIAPKFGITPLGTEINWKPLDSYTTKEMAEINKIKADTAAAYVAMGALDGFDVRQNIIADPDSGYNGIDPIVPEGPGDREHEQKVAAEARENENKPDGEAQDSALYAGVLFRAGGRILLMKRRDDDTQGGKWSFPAGKIELDETAYDGALREFREETGMDLFNVIPEGSSLNPLIQTGDFMLFTVEGQGFAPILNDEHTAAMWVLPNELPSPLHPNVAEQIAKACHG